MDWNIAMSMGVLIAPMIWLNRVNIW